MSRNFNVDAYENYIATLGDVLQLGHFANKAVATARATRRMSKNHVMVWDLNPDQCDEVTLNTMRDYFIEAVEAAIKRDPRIRDCQIVARDHIELHNTLCRLTLEITTTVHTQQQLRHLQLQ